MKANCYLVGKGELEMFSSNTHSARVLCRMADNLGFMDSGNIKARKNKDLESLCFDCGSTDGLIVKSEGVALCAKCWAKDEAENKEGE